MEMPKRSDPKYQEIENFKDYELTNCIAYEMVIRNDEFIESKKKLYKMYEENYNQWIIDVKKVEEKFGLTIVTKSDFITNEKRHRLKKGSFVSRVYAQNINTGESFYLDDNLAVNKLAYGVNSIDTIRQKSFSHIIMARPTLKFPNMKKTHIELNLALPQEELSSYIEEIKKKYLDNPKIIKTAHDIFTYEEPKLNSNLSMEEKKVIMANRFYTYDYITQKQKELEESNNRYREEYEDKIEQINNNDFYSFKDKQENIKVEKEKLRKTLFSTAYTNISKDDDICSELQQNYKTIQRYYSEIKPYIYDMKYKELITGLQL